MLHWSLEAGGTPWSQMAQPYHISCNFVVGKLILSDPIWEQVAQYWPSIVDDSTANEQVNQHVYYCV